MSKFLQFLTEISARLISVFWFLEDNLNEYKLPFTKPGMCSDIMEIWLGLLMGKF